MILLVLPLTSPNVLKLKLEGLSISNVGVDVYPDPPSEMSILLITPNCSRTTVALGAVVPVGVNETSGGVV